MNGTVLSEREVSVIRSVILEGTIWLPDDMEAWNSLLSKLNLTEDDFIEAESRKP